MTSGPSVELRQSTANLLQLPIFIAVVDVVVVVSQFFHGGPGVTLLVVCGAVLALDAALATYLLRNLGATLVVTADSIKFVGHGGDVQSTITRAPTSSLRFRAARNGPLGSTYTGYTLMLRDDATGEEVFAGAFGRAKVRQACESQGWTFS